MARMFLFLGPDLRRPPQLHNQLDEVVLLGASVDSNVTCGQEVAQFAHGELASEIVVRIVAHHQRHALRTRRPTTEAPGTCYQTSRAVQLNAAGTLL